MEIAKVIRFGLPRIIALLAPVIVLSSCREKAEYLRLPPQYQPSARSDFIPYLPLLTMGTQIAEENTIEGIYGNSPWPWSNEHPRFLCLLQGRGPWQFVLEYAGASATLKDTGPVTVRISINGAPFATLVISAEGRGEYVRDVPLEMPLSGPVLVDLSIQPFWTSPQDGLKHGILIHSIGFQKRPA